MDAVFDAKIPTQTRHKRGRFFTKYLVCANTDIKYELPKSCSNFDPTAYLYSKKVKISLPLPVYFKLVARLFKWALNVMEEMTIKKFIVHENIPIIDQNALVPHSHYIWDTIENKVVE